MGQRGLRCFFFILVGFDGLRRWVECDKEALGSFIFIRVGFDGVCRWDKVAVGGYFHQGGI